MARCNVPHPLISTFSCDHRLGHSGPHEILLYGGNVTWKSRFNMWNVIGKLLVKVALWAVNHPDEITAVVEAAKSAKNK
jgi:hypothetical protein